MFLKPGVKLIEERVGVGGPLEKGDRVKVLLAGWLNGGEALHEREELEVVVGGRVLVAGLEYAINGMRVGGMRKVKISPHLGYGAAGVAGRVPPNAVLTYAIEVVEKIAGREPPAAVDRQ